MIKTITKWNKSHDANGNAIAKVFYDDSTTKILNAEETEKLKNEMGNSSYTKYYKSLSGLRNSK